MSEQTQATQAAIPATPTPSPLPASTPHAPLPPYTIEMRPCGLVSRACKIPATGSGAIVNSLFAIATEEEIAMGAYVEAKNLEIETLKAEVAKLTAEVAKLTAEKAAANATVSGGQSSARGGQQGKR